MPPRKYRHPATISAQQLIWARRRYAERFTTTERLALDVLIGAFERIAEANPDERN